MSSERGALRRRFAHELRETRENPSRVRQLANPEAVRALVATLRGRNPQGVEGGPWAERDADGFIGRRYGSYDEYIRHQQAKLDTLDLSGYDVRYRELLAARLKQAGHVERRARVLCLAARIGTEVKAFHDVGCFALGIDLNPGDGNRYVVHGDFHDLQFPDGSVDLVFTNSLDHALEPERIFREVRRVLGPDGLFVVESSLGREEGAAPRRYESFFWDRVDDLLALIERHGFERLSQRRFDDPWPGIHATLRVQAGSQN